MRKVTLFFLSNFAFLLISNQDAGIRTVVACLTSLSHSCFSVRNTTYNFATSTALSLIKLEHIERYDSPRGKISSPERERYVYSEGSAFRLLKSCIRSYTVTTPCVCPVTQNHQTFMSYLLF